MCVSVSCVYDVYYVDATTSCYRMCFCLLLGYGVGYDDIVIKGDLEKLEFVAYYTK